MVEVKIILKNGREIDFIAKDKILTTNEKVVMYKTGDGTVYTITVDEIAVASERQFKTKNFSELSESLGSRKF